MVTRRQTIAFLSSRDGEQQVYWITLDGGDANQLSSLSGGADTSCGHLTENGSRLFRAFIRIARMRPAMRNAKRRNMTKSKVKARIYEICSIGIGTAGRTARAAIFL